MKIYYRVSNNGYSKIKPAYITKINCLKNFLHVFKDHHNDITIIGDNLKDADVLNLVSEHKLSFEATEFGNAGAFLHCLDKVLQLPDNEQVYFVEDDYVHKPGSPLILQEGFNLGVQFISLYDHPDKYNGGNIFTVGGGEDTRVYLSNSCHWKITNSTTMTFASVAGILKRVNPTIRHYIQPNQHPDDFHLFLKLRQLGLTLITPIPGYATHGETAWLTPLTEWSDVVVKTNLI